MKLTRIIAIGILFGSVALTASKAQTLRDAQPPAEFPPASFKASQYVDSRGCIYIRAGIDGNVTWVPRVTRGRKQVCGYQPTAVAGSTAVPAPVRAPVVITVAPTATPTAPAAVRAPVAQPRPTVATLAPTTRTTTARPAPTYRPATVAPPAAPAAPAITATPPIQPRSATTPATTGGCPNASAFSQQFINKTGVRCGPQSEPPITYGKGWERSSLLAPDTRIVPRHVYERRQNTTNVTVPTDYRTVWKDDRLNPHRAERTQVASIIMARSMVPAGYKRVERGDDRLNPNRAYRTASGDRQTDRIWTRELPRRLAPVPTTAPIVTLPKERTKSPAEARAPFLIRISTRSAPGATLGANLARVAAVTSGAAAPAENRNARR